MNRSTPMHPQAFREDVHIETKKATLDGILEIPQHATGLVLFVHGSGSSRHSPRNQHVAHVLQKAGLGTLLFDLLTRDEEQIDQLTAELRFNIGFLADRLRGATSWAAGDERTAGLRIGYFGSSTGAAAALVAAADEGDRIGAIVSRGGRPDLAGDALQRVHAPTLLLVGGKDEQVITMNTDAFARLKCEKRLEIVPGASHLFEEPGKLDIVADLAAGWFVKHLPPHS